MKKFTLSIFAGLTCLCYGLSAPAATVPTGETDITTLEWVNNGQDCTLDFDNDEGGTVFGTDAGGSTLSYVDLSAYGVIKLYGPANQTARLFLNRAEYGDNGIFFVEIGEDGIGTFDCNTVLEKQPKAQYIHLNGVKASAWNTQLNLSLITASGDPIEFPTFNFELSEGETDLTTLEWVNEAQACDNRIGEETDATIYGTHDGPADGKLSYIDITNYNTLKIYGRSGDVVRCFINRAEYSDGTFQFYITIGEDGVGSLDLADVYATQEGATYVHLNGIKTAATWQGSPTGKALVKAITLAGTASEEPTTGINLIGADAADTMYFGINGQRIMNPAAGQTVIKVANGKVSKVVIR